MEKKDGLSLTRVVLFKIGIGSFEKRGTIDLSSKKSVKLSFSKGEMNDLLKTFSILRLKGDLMVSGVSYEAKDIDRNKLLEDSSINLPENNSLSALIKQLRGVEVEIRIGDKTSVGKILGTEIMNVVPNDQAVVEEEFVLISKKDGTIETLPVSKIQELEIIESEIKKDFDYFLETIVGQNKEKNKIVTIFFEGKEKSEYILNFLQVVPAWKTSYRLFIKKSSENGKDEQKDLEKKETEIKKSETKKSEIKDIESPNYKAQLQGWAIIDNVLDEDWENVDLTLVTGLPISFIYDSYSPAWIPRPTIERKTDLGAKIVQFDRALEQNKGGMTRSAPPKLAKKMLTMLGSTKAMPPPSPAPAAMKEFAFDKLSAAEPASLYQLEQDDYEETETAAESSFESGAEAKGGKGVAFKYHINTPVFVKRNQSSLIPILQGDINGKIISVYNESVNPKNPILSFDFDNTTEMTLEEGPISVFIDNVFSGEAILPFLESNEHSRIPYAVDQAINIKHSMKSIDDHFNRLDIKDMIYQYYFTTYVHSYNINNAGTTPREIIIEHPRVKDREFYDTHEPDEKTAGFFRFFVKIKSKENIEFVIKERKVECSYQRFAQITQEDIENWFNLKLINEKEKGYFLERLDLQKNSNKIEESINNLKDKINMIYEEQDRLRENLKALKNSKSEKILREKYVNKFELRETELEQMLKEIENLSSEFKWLIDKMIQLDKNFELNKDKGLQSSNVNKRHPNGEV